MEGNENKYKNRKASGVKNDISCGVLGRKCSSHSRSHLLALAREECEVGKLGIFMVIGKFAFQIV